jgi:hypothetical protein
MSSNKYRIVYSGGQTTRDQDGDEKKEKWGEPEGVYWIDFETFRPSFRYLQGLYTSPDLPEDTVSLVIRGDDETPGLQIDFDYDASEAFDYVDLNLHWSDPFGGFGQNALRFHLNEDWEDESFDFETPKHVYGSEPGGIFPHDFTFQYVDLESVVIDSIDVFYNADTEWPQEEIRQWYDDLHAAYEVRSLWYSRKPPAIRFHPVFSGEEYILELGDIEAGDRIRQIIAVQNAEPDTDKANYYQLEEITIEMLEDRLRNPSYIAFDSIESTSRMTLHQLPAFREIVQQEHTALILVDADPIPPLPLAFQHAVADPITTGLIGTVAGSLIWEKLIKPALKKRRGRK